MNSACLISTLLSSIYNNGEEACSLHWIRYKKVQDYDIYAQCYGILYKEKNLLIDIAWRDTLLYLSI